MRIFLHAAAGALLGACAGAFTFVAAYAWSPALTLEMTHDRAGAFAGLYPGERSGDLTFAWTTGRADFRLAGLDRRVPWEVRVRARGARQDPATLPTLTLLADGVPLTADVTTNDYQEFVAATPVLTGRRGLTLSVAASDTFVPGPHDRRTLGVQVDRVTVAPASATVLAPVDAVVTAALGAGMFGAVFGLFSATALTAVVAASLLAIGQAAVLRLGTAPYATVWLDHMTEVALGISLVLVSVIVFLVYARRMPLRNTARFAILFSGAVLYLKLLVLLHPDTWLVDAVFQVHRLQDVMAGRLYFTSVAPGGYQFPYAIGLYVAALPFTAWVADRVELLRVLVAVADVTSIALLYWALARAWGDRLTAAVAVGIAQLIPVGFDVQRAANLTNAFGQALGVASLAMVLARSGRPVRWWWSATIFVLLAWAMLSHTSTFATVSAITVVGAVLVLLAGRPADRPYGWWIGGVAIAAVVVAVGLYYAHFMPTYRAELARISAEVRAGPDAEAADSQRLYQPGGASIQGRLRAVPNVARTTYTTGFLLLALAGLFAGVGRFRRDAAWLVVSGWLVACGLLAAIGVLTPVAFRHYYAAQPAVGVLAALGLVTLWRAGRPWQWVGAGLAAWGIAASIDRWLLALRVSL